MQRFWTLVERGEPSACWRWKGGYDARGRPFFSSIGGLRILANRFAFELTVGPLNRGEVILHACGDDQCVNPSHLRRSPPPATGARPGRYRRGSRSKMAKLTEEAVRDIRRRAAQGASHLELAAEYGVSQSAISRAVNDRAWRHVRSDRMREEHASDRPAG